MKILKIKLDHWLPGITIEATEPDSQLMSALNRSKLEVSKILQHKSTFFFQNELVHCHLSGCCLKTLVGHNGAITAVQFNPDGTLVISCSYDGKCCVWDVLSGCCLKMILSAENSQLPISHARLSPNGKYLLMSTLDSIIRLWDYKIGQGRLIKKYQGN